MDNHTLLKPAPQRVVSLVPSLTESLFDLGFGARVVGVSDYCIHPHQELLDIPRVGGTKNVDVNRVLELQPELVIANQEENSKADIEYLKQRGLNIWITFPKTVSETIQMLFDLCNIFRGETAVLRVDQLEKSSQWVRLGMIDCHKRFFCPIWQQKDDDGIDWWMTCNQDTYTSDILTLCGGENVFSQRVRRYPLSADLGSAEPEDPGARDTRYPRVTMEEIRSASPEIIFLPSEPYPFSNDDAAEICRLFEDTPAVKNKKVYLLDGTLVTWCGTRLAHALDVLPEFFAGE